MYKFSRLVLVGESKFNAFFLIDYSVISGCYLIFPNFKLCFSKLLYNYYFKTLQLLSKHTFPSSSFGLSLDDTYIRMQSSQYIIIVVITLCPQSDTELLAGRKKYFHFVYYRFPASATVSGKY